MRTLLDTEEAEDQAPEITLSTASVLGIFFGLVLVCGVFFGFGYSMGRGTEMGTQVIKIGGPVPTVAEPAPVEAEDTTPPAAPAKQAEQQTSPQGTGEGAAEPGASPYKPAVNAVASDNGSETEIRHEEPKKPSPVLQAALNEQPATVAASMSAPSGTGQPMVQIAAVARQEDANVLVSALRQRGYGVSVRSEPQDRLLHVQVGPFANHTQAAAMKQKLLSDGYNAIIKE